MKILTSLLIVLFLGNTAWADAPADPVEKDKKEAKSLAIVISSNDEDKSKIDREQLKKKISDLVHSKIAADDKIPPEMRDEIVSDIQEAIEDLDSSLSDKQVMNLSNAVEMGQIIGLIAVILLFSTPVLIVLILSMSTYRKRKMTLDTIRTIVENGQEVPHELFENQPKSAKSNLQRGLVLIGVGLGIMISFSLMGELEIGAIGLIPLFIGLARVIIWKLEKPGVSEQASQ